MLARISQLCLLALFLGTLSYSNGSAASPAELRNPAALERFLDGKESSAHLTIAAKGLGVRSLVLNYQKEFDANLQTASNSSSPLNLGRFFQGKLFKHNNECRDNSDCAESTPAALAIYNDRKDLKLQLTFEAGVAKRAKVFQIEVPFKILKGKLLGKILRAPQHVDVEANNDTTEFPVVLSGLKPDRSTLLVTDKRNCGLREVMISLAADYEMVKKHGGASATANYMLGVINIVDSVYRSTFGLTLKIESLQIFDNENDPFTDTKSTGRLEEFTKYIGENSSIENSADTYMLFSGIQPIPFDSVGIAWENGMCINQESVSVIYRNSYPTHMPIVVAHELGHLFHAAHTDSQLGHSIMYPGSNDSMFFADQSRSEIAGFLASPASLCLELTDICE